MNIPRAIQSSILRKLQPNKVVVIYGPRQVGKTTLLHHVLPQLKEDYLFLSGEDRTVQPWLASQSIEKLKENVGKNKILIIDEAQKVPEIGLNLKLIVDHIKGIKVLATGSSSFELAHQVGEPLVGRKWQFYLYPIAQLEMNQLEAPYQTKTRLESRLIYGGYPEVITTKDAALKRELLNSIVDSYLYRDILELNGIRKPRKIIDVLKMLAFQIGSEVSLSELGNNVNLDLRTIERYLDLLEKVFVIRKADGFSRNLRKEITKNSRYYFFDSGIRNALINNFNDLKTRNDVGQLWENYLFMERIKKQHYQNIHVNRYFWRTYTQQEIDLVEEREGKLFGYEFKWGRRQGRHPPEWRKAYPEAEYRTINQDNYLDFIT
jgi:predicted AAA+ superfamily ATPase